MNTTTQETMPATRNGNSPAAAAAAPAPAAPATMPTSPEELLALALSSGAGMDTIERMTALYERAQAKAAEQSFWAALAAAQGEFPPIAKTRNVEGRYKYASLDDLMAQVTPIMARHGLSATFNRTFNANEAGETVSVSSSLVLHHRDGHEQAFPPVTVPIEDRKSRAGNSLMTGSQVVGCAMTYADRYAYQGGLGIRPCDEDTDGNVDRPRQAEPIRQPQRKAPPRPTPEQDARRADREELDRQQGHPEPGNPNWRLITIEAYNEKPTRKGTPRYSIMITGKQGEQVWASTFSESHGLTLKRAHAENRRVWVRFEVKGDFVNVEDVEDAPGS